jgi:hypothetical protein
MTVLLTELAQATAAILAHSLEGVTVGQAAAMLTEADIDVEHPQRLRMLHRFLIRHPQALTASIEIPSPVFVRLAQTLHRHGHTSVPLLGCAGCGARDRRMNRRDERGRPVCNACYRSPQRRCGRCGRVRPVGLRGRDGRPDLCTGCHQGQVRECSSADAPASLTAPLTGHFAATHAFHAHLDDASSVDSQHPCRRIGPSVRSAFRATHAFARTRPPAWPATRTGH